MTYGSLGCTGSTARVASENFHSWWKVKEKQVHLHMAEQEREREAGGAAHFKLDLMRTHYQ